ncbi:MAG: diacylglycerol kinase family protein [Ruminococcaceae bacterium]|nr:diacylglycerol kinase family protein [Oscillospiraceae bacterium]
MNYILYNPKANNENNDLNLVPGAEELEKRGVKKVSLIGLDVPAFCQSLSADDRVLICGGDGTLHHFANNAYGLEFPCSVCALRSGTGNDFLNDIGQQGSENLIDIREYLKNLPEVEIKGEKRRCLNGVGLGVDGAVCHGVEEFKARTNKKKANYTTIALEQLLGKYKRPTGRVTVDGVTHEYKDLWAICTMKGKYFGGGMMIAPGQNRESGKISVMAMHGCTRLKTLTVFLKVFKGNHVKHTEMVEIFEGYDVTVEFDEPRDLQIDGEVYTDVSTYTVRCPRPENTEE